MASIDSDTIPVLRNRNNAVLFAGNTLVLLAIISSGISAEFLFPLLQLYLFIYSIPAIFIGLLGGWRRRWSLTLGLTIAIMAVCVTYDVQTNRFGYRAIYDMYIRGQPPPPGFMYFHGWLHVLSVTMIVLFPGVAITVHALIECRRFSILNNTLHSARCGHCNYLLRGLLENRCPECGQQFDLEQVSKALRVLDGVES